MLQNEESENKGKWPQKLCGVFRYGGRKLISLTVADYKNCTLRNVDCSPWMNQWLFLAKKAKAANIKHPIEWELSWQIHKRNLKKCFSLGPSGWSSRAIFNRYRILLKAKLSKMRIWKGKKRNKTLDWCLFKKQWWNWTKSLNLCLCSDLKQGLQKKIWRRKSLYFSTYGRMKIYPIKRKRFPKEKDYNWAYRGSNSLFISSTKGGRSIKITKQNHNQGGKGTRYSVLLEFQNCFQTLKRNSLGIFID